MDENHVEGALQNIAGKIHDAVGGLTGGTQAQVAGKARQLAGQAQRAYGEVFDQAQDATSNVSRRVEQQPLTSLLIAVAAGYALGWLTLRR